MSLQPGGLEPPTNENDKIDLAAWISGEVGVARSEVRKAIALGQVHIEDAKTGEKVTDLAPTTADIHPRDLEGKAVVVHGDVQSFRAIYR